MAGATRRSDIACQRLAYNPLEDDRCLGFEAPRKSCKNQVPRHSREIAYFILGQGSHLFSDAGELRAILLEAADYLHCCPEHRNSEDVVEKWIKAWNKREGPDRKIQSLIQERVFERKTTNKKWPGQAAFENSVGQIARSNMPPNRKLEKVKHAIWEDCFQESQSKPSTRRPTFRPRLTIDLPRPEALHLATGRPRGSDSPSPISSLPTNLDYSESPISPTSPLDTVAEGQVLDLTAGLPTCSDIRPVVRPQVTAAEPVVRPEWETRLTSMPAAADPECRPWFSSSSSRRGRSLSYLGSALFRAVTQQATPAVTRPSSSHPTSSLSGATSFAGPSSRQEITSSANSRIEPVEEDVTAPTGLSASTTVVEDVAQSSSEAEPSTRPAPQKAASDPTGDIVTGRAGGLSLTSALRFAGISIAPRQLTECEICLETFDAGKPHATWQCPTCHKKVHHSCFSQWWRANFDIMRQTPCPYCRTIFEWR